MWVVRTNGEEIQFLGIEMNELQPIRGFLQTQKVEIFYTDLEGNEVKNPRKSKRRVPVGETDGSDVSEDEEDESFRVNDS